jgi:hypothetical protein
MWSLAAKTTSTSTTTAPITDTATGLRRAEVIANGDMMAQNRGVRVELTRT